MDSVTAGVGCGDDRLTNVAESAIRPRRSTTVVVVARACVALGALTIFGVAHAQRPPPPPSSGTGLIIGRAVDSAGHPLGGVIVEFRSQGQWQSSAQGNVQIAEAVTRRVKTDDEGEFLFADLPKASFALIARKVGYEDGALGRRYPQGYAGVVPLAAGERRTDITIMLWKDAAISGVVTDEAGAAVAGEAVRVMRRMVVAGHARLQSNGMAMTDDRGAYRIAGLAPGKYAVVFNGQQHVLSFAADDGRTAATTGMVYPAATFPATANGGEPVMVTLAAGDDLRDADFHLTPMPAARVSGVVMGADGPMARMPLQLIPAPDGPIAGLGRSTTTGADGRFTFEPVPAGSYVLNARKDPSPLGAGAVQDAPQDVTIRTGQTTITTNLGNQTRPTRPPRHDSTEPTWWADVPVVVGASAVGDVVVSMRSSISVTGHVEFEGVTAAPTAAVLNNALDIFLDPADARAVYVPPARVDVSADGRFMVFGVTPDRYVVRASVSNSGWTLKAATVGDLDVFLQPITISTKDIDGLTLVFTDRRSQISGSVMDATSRLAPGASVLCFPADRRRWVDYGASSERMRRVTVLEGGVYVTPMPPGEYFLVATLDDAAADWQDPETLDALARVATRVTIGEGEMRRQDLRVQQLK